jgi:luciferase family oxidoreductase group 1
MSVKAKSSLAVSVLDLVGMRPGEKAGNAIARTVDLARQAEAWGYKRYWLAEHHSIAGLACSATAVLIGHVAGATGRIRVGSGGVMLPNHAPLVVAEQFGTLEAMYPGRIDLGLGRAPGGDGYTMRALRRGLSQSGDDFPELLEELRTYLGPERPGQMVRAFPGQGSRVPITLLGSSTYSAQLAARLGLPFAFAAHFAPDDLFAGAELYHRQFEPSGDFFTPYFMVAVQVIASDTDEKARKSFCRRWTRWMGCGRRASGRRWKAGSEPRSWARTQRSRQGWRNWSGRPAPAKSLWLPILTRLRIGTIRTAGSARLRRAWRPILQAAWPSARDRPVPARRKFAAADQAGELQGCVNMESSPGPGCKRLSTQASARGAELMA